MDEHIHSKSHLCILAFDETESLSGRCVWCTAPCQVVTLNNVTYTQTCVWICNMYVHGKIFQAWGYIVVGHTYMSTCNYRIFSQYIVVCSHANSIHDLWILGFKYWSSGRITNGRSKSLTLIVVSNQSLAIGPTKPANRCSTKSTSSKRLLPCQNSQTLDWNHRSWLCTAPHFVRVCTFFVLFPAIWVKAKQP